MAMKLPKADLDQAYKGAWYTVAGAGGDLREWVDGMTNLLEKEGIGRPAEWYVSKGTDVNRKFKLKGENRFQADLVFLFFPLDGMKVERLSTFKIRMHDHWFNDLIDNRR